MNNAKLSTLKDKLEERNVLKNEVEKVEEEIKEVEEKVKTVKKKK